ncbi:MAG: aminomethyl-transferring glycine dehydrogenase subunit GcvPB [Gammaproteobacteria bacterium]|nr:aminomethyl-transferring glycine dehydrogenase subunit GcvPB [Gammaproteobacteria bacterium]
MLIFETSHYCSNDWLDTPKVSDIPEAMLRAKAPKLPRVGELEAVRHYTRLSQKNFSIDTNFYPLGSCTMKYNPRAAHKLALLQGFAGRHPFAQLNKSQGLMSCLHELQTILMELTGMKGASLSPMAGAQGEFAGVAMIKAYHEARNDTERSEIIVPDAAHGTNPATAAMCGYQVKEIPTNADGDIDLEALAKALGPKTAGIMLTNPSTFGVFERQIKQIAAMVHKAGGLLYYDGANLNAIMGKVRPGDMGFDVMHMNLHKTFATPHGGGGPGAGPVLVGERLVPYLPVPFVAKKAEQYSWVTEKELPTTIGRLSGFMGNAGILIRAYIYARMLGRDGLTRASEIAVLNANYLMKSLQKAGFTLAFPKRRATHEFIVTMQPENKKYGVNALDISKSLLDYGIHAPTMYFPSMVPECLLIEPTETESKQELDTFIVAMTEIRQMAASNPEALKAAPITQPVRRMDDIKAAKELDLTWKG